MLLTILRTSIASSACIWKRDKLGACRVRLRPGGRSCRLSWPEALSGHDWSTKNLLAKRDLSGIMTLALAFSLQEGSVRVVKGFPAQAGKLFLILSLGRLHVARYRAGDVDERCCRAMLAMNTLWDIESSLLFLAVDTAQFLTTRSASSGYSSAELAVEFHSGR